MILFPYYVYLIFIIIPTLATSPGQRERERERQGAILSGGTRERASTARYSTVIL